MLRSKFAQENAEAKAAASEGVPDDSRLVMCTKRKCAIARKRMDPAVEVSGYWACGVDIAKIPVPDNTTNPAHDTTAPVSSNDDVVSSLAEGVSAVVLSH